MLVVSLLVVVFSFVMMIVGCVHLLVLVIMYDIVRAIAISFVGAVVCGCIQFVSDVDVAVVVAYVVGVARIDVVGVTVVVRGCIFCCGLLCCGFLCCCCCCRFRCIPLNCRCVYRCHAMYATTITTTIPSTPPPSAPTPTSITPPTPTL